MSINANEICYDLHYDYSSYNDTNFTVRRFLEKKQRVFVNGKIVQHSMSMIVLKLNYDLISMSLKSNYD